MTIALWGHTLDQHYTGLRQVEVGWQKPSISIELVKTLLCALLSMPAVSVSQGDGDDDDELDDDEDRRTSASAKIDLQAKVYVTLGQAWPSNAHTQGNTSSHAHVLNILKHVPMNTLVNTQLTRSLLVVIIGLLGYSSNTLRILVEVIVHQFLPPI